MTKRIDKSSGGADPERLRQAVDEVFLQEKDPLWLRILGPILGALVVAGVFLGVVWIVVKIATSIVHMLGWA